MNELRMDTVLGELRLIADAQSLVAICFSGQAWEYAGPTVLANTPVLLAAASWVDDWLVGNSATAPPRAHLGTAFQQSVWSALLEIPRGASRSYGAVAAQIGKPSAVRALGAAVGRNPWSLLVPCHRVLGAAGGLTGYAGGLGRKRALLALEQGLALPWRRVHAPYQTQYHQPLNLRPGNGVRWQPRPDDGEFPGWAFALSDRDDVPGAWVPQAWFSSDGSTGKARRSYTSRELDVAPGDQILELDQFGGWAYARHADGRCGWLPLTVLAP